MPKKCPDEDGKVERLLPGLLLKLMLKSLNFCFVVGEIEKFVGEVKRAKGKVHFKRISPISSEIHFFISFYLYIYLPDSQESEGDATHRVNNYPDLLPEMPRYCCPLVIFYFSFLVLWKYD